jgi:hypothetical protein
MGKLLSSAIKMQGTTAVANPTLIIDFTDFTLGSAALEVYKNGAYFDDVLSGIQKTILIVAGDTFYLRMYAPFTGFISATYYINAVSQGTQSTTSVLSTTSRTASGTNAYSYNVIADFF